jgi:uncharacterized protein YehS (DUF1456 family)
MNEKKLFINCEKCGKRLIERLPNGLWKFVFGKNLEELGEPPVEMLIQGNIVIKCLRRSCRYKNQLNFFPFFAKDE